LRQIGAGPPAGAPGVRAVGSCDLLVGLDANAFPSRLDSTRLAESSRRRYDYLI